MYHLNFFFKKSTFWMITSGDVNFQICVLFFLTPLNQMKQKCLCKDVWFMAAVICVSVNNQLILFRWREGTHSLRPDRTKFSNKWPLQIRGILFVFLNLRPTLKKNNNNKLLLKINELYFFSPEKLPKRRGWPWTKSATGNKLLLTLFTR